MTWADYCLQLMQKQANDSWCELLGLLDDELSNAILQMTPDIDFSQQLSVFLATPLSGSSSQSFCSTYENFSEFSMAHQEITCFPKLRRAIESKKLSLLEKQMQYLLQQNQVLVNQVAELAAEKEALKSEVNKQAQTLRHQQEMLSHITQLDKTTLSSENSNMMPMLDLVNFDELIQKNFGLLRIPKINRELTYTGKQFFNYRKKLLALTQEIFLSITQIKMNLDRESITRKDTTASHKTKIDLIFIKQVLSVLYDRIGNIFRVQMMFAQKKINNEASSSSQSWELALSDMIQRFHNAANIQKVTKKQDAAKEENMTSVLEEIIFFVTHLKQAFDSLLTWNLSSESLVCILTREQILDLSFESPGIPAIYSILEKALKTRSNVGDVLLHRDPVAYSQGLLKTLLEPFFLELKMNVVHGSTGQTVAKLAGKAAAAVVPFVGGVVKTTLDVGVSMSRERTKNSHHRQIEGLTDSVIQETLNLLIETLSLWSPQIHLLARVHRESQEKASIGDEWYKQVIKNVTFFTQEAANKQTSSSPLYVDFIRLLADIIKNYFETRETSVGEDVSAQQLLCELVGHMFACQPSFIARLAEKFNIGLIEIPMNEHESLSISMHSLLQGCPLQGDEGELYFIRKKDGTIVTREDCSSIPLAEASKSQLSYILAVQGFEVVPRHLITSDALQVVKI